MGNGLAALMLPSLIESGEEKRFVKWNCFEQPIANAQVNPGDYVGRQDLGSPLAYMSGSDRSQSLNSSK